MNYKTQCVIDYNGFYKTLVLITSKYADFSAPEILYYSLDNNERLIDAKPPGSSFCKPRWDGACWTEGATDAEVTAWEAAKPIPEPAPPSQVEHLAVEMTMAMAAMQMEHDMAIAEVTMAMAGTEVIANV